MEPTTGFALEGLLRQLMPAAAGMIGFIFFVFVVVWLMRRTLMQARLEAGVSEEEARQATSWLTWARNTAVLFALAMFGWTVVTTTAVNRMPRSDLDGSAVYDQMQQNINRTN